MKNFSIYLVNFNMSSWINYESFYVCCCICFIVFDGWEVCGDYCCSRGMFVVDYFGDFFVLLVLKKRWCVCYLSVLRSFDRGVVEGV